MRVGRALAIDRHFGGAAVDPQRYPVPGCDCESGEIKNYYSSYISRGGGYRQTSIEVLQ